ncbi:DUF421 domain-containing protein [Mesobacillus jeotgali]|uniref:DUF421 domain-containing protein n=1 Tax=Mesobacillus jeotgali TaxID=129985 RepID=UPI0009A66571|nr:DUF421 domain-containing protein [Mesobacillus jeotgali]
MDGMLGSVIRTAISFLLLIGFTYEFGKHVNSHKNHYNFALTITMGSLIANMGFNMRLKFSEMLLSFITLVVMYYIFLILAYRSRKIRGVIAGQPTILIEKGRIMEENMKKVKFSIDDLTQRLREIHVFNLSEVDYAMLEVSGNLSIIKKSPYQNPTRKDLNFPLVRQSLPIELIIDGTIIEKNAEEPFNMDWIKGECKKRNLQIEDVYYAVINSEGKLFIDKYKDI